jgi:broad specificity phosphatase PhoE
MQIIPQADMEVGAKQAVQAIQHFFKPTKGADKHELVVCHGNIIRFFVVCAIGAPMEAWVNMDINHCGITEIRVDPGGGLRLVTHNDVGHLTPDLRTFG